MTCTRSESNLSKNPDITLKEATSSAMKEVFAPIISTTLVLLAVFVPVTFIPGISGALYQQFALTIAFAVIISSINALTLSPALCATILRRKKQDDKLGILDVAVKINENQNCDIEMQMIKQEYIKERILFLEPKRVMVP